MNQTHETVDFPFHSRCHDLHNQTITAVGGVAEDKQQQQQQQTNKNRRKHTRELRIRIAQEGWTWGEGVVDGRGASSIHVDTVVMKTCVKGGGCTSSLTDLGWERGGGGGGRFC